MAAASDPPSGALGALAGLLGLRQVGRDGDATDEAADLGLVGQVQRPRFLLPLGHRAATTAACLAYVRLRPRTTQATRVAVAAAAGAGFAGRVTSARYAADRSPGSLLAHLGEVLGEPDLQVAIGVGNHDEVWKPTLQCFTPDGDPVAYVKVGLGPVGAHLVATERNALERWEDHDDPRLVVPGLRAATTWDGHPVICTEPMPLDVRRVPDGPIGAWPVRLLDPPLPDRPIGEAPWWTERVARHSTDADADVAEVLATIGACHRTGERAWARWHGDWVPWNMARSGRGLVVWDWEYSEPGAPVGLDEVHRAYQVTRVRDGSTVEVALAAARQAAGDDWVADAHLAMLLTRGAWLRALSGTEANDHAAVVGAARRRSGPTDDHR